MCWKRKNQGLTLWRLMLLRRKISIKPMTDVMDQTLMMLKDLIVPSSKRPLSVLAVSKIVRLVLRQKMRGEHEPGSEAALVALPGV